MKPTEPTFELKLVLAARNRLSLSLKSTGVLNSSKYSTTFFAAREKDSAMIVGWIPLPSSFSAAPSRAPARTTTDVVPSPASISCAAERSTSWKREKRKMHLLDELIMSDEEEDQKWIEARKQPGRVSERTHHSSSRMHHTHMF